MNFVFMLYLVGLFFVFTPGVLFTFPVKGIYKIALVHASLFGLAYYLTYMMLLMTEGFQDPPKPASICGNDGYPSSDGSMRLYTQQECEKNKKGIWQKNGECMYPNGKSISFECRYLNKDPPKPPAPMPPAPMPPNPIVPPAEYPTRTCSPGKSCPYGTSCPKTDHGFPGDYCASLRLKTPNVFPCTKGDTINGYCPSGSKCFSHDDGRMSCVTPQMKQITS